MSTFKATITSLTFKGLGITRSPEGKIYFIPNTWPGDSGTFEVVNEQKSYGEAIVVEIEKYSEERQSPPCQYQDQCGGCPWMIGTYASQLKYKEDIFRSLLKRYKIPDVSFQVIASPLELGYKSRAQFKIEKNKVGFFKSKSHDVVDIEECKILSPKMNQLLTELRGRDYTDLKKFSLDDNSPMDFPKTYRSPFSQGHSLQNVFMKEWLQKTISKLNPEAPVLELFSGSGNFTEVLQEHFQNITAIDSFEPGVNELGQKFPDLKAICLDLYQKPSSELNNLINQAEVLMVDPPRAGLKNLNVLGDKLENLIYISCNPDTYLKDISPLLSKGFEIQDLKIVDAFPHTSHMEIVSFLKMRS